MLKMGGVVSAWNTNVRNAASVSQTERTVIIRTEIVFAFFIICTRRPIIDLTMVGQNRKNGHLFNSVVVVHYLALKMVARCLEFSLKELATLTQ